MAVFTSFEYGTGIVYGTDAVSTDIVASIDFLHTDQVRIAFTNEVVVTPVLLDPASYLLTSDAGEIPVFSVRVPAAEIVTEVIIHTATRTVGAYYALTISPLQLRDGSTLGGTGAAILYNTKATNMFNAVPSLFDLRPNSPLRVFFEAVSISDDLIGGARSRLL